MLIALTQKGKTRFFTYDDYLNLPLEEVEDSTVQAVPTYVAAQYQLLEQPKPQTDKGTQRHGNQHRPASSPDELVRRLARKALQAKSIDIYTWEAIDEDPTCAWECSEFVEFVDSMRAE